LSILVLFFFFNTLFPSAPGHLRRSEYLPIAEVVGLAKS